MSDPGTAPPPASFRKWRVPWGGLICAAAMVYAAAAFLKPPWHDELFSRLLSAQPLPDILGLLRNDSGPPLYYFILHLWGKLMGGGVPALRLFSALSILVAGVFFVRIMRRISAALPVPALLALFYLFPLNLYYAVEARAYAPLMLLTWIFLDLLFSSRRIWALTLVFALMLYTHNLALLYIPLLLLLPFVFREVKLFLVPLLSGLAYLPFLPILLAQPKESILWMQEPFSAGRIMTFLSGMGPLGPAFPMFPIGGPFGSAKGVLLPLVAVCVALIVGAGCFHREKAVRVCALGFVLTGGVLLGISACGVNLYFPSRGEALVFPFFFVIVLSVLGLLKPFIVRPFAACILLLLMVQTALWLPYLPAQQPLGEIPQRMKPFLKDGDRLYIIGPWRLTLAHYLGNAGVRPTAITLPFDQAYHPGWYRCSGLLETDLEWLKGKSKDRPVFLFSDMTNPCDAQLRAAMPDLQILGSSGPFYFARVR